MRDMKINDLHPTRNNLSRDESCTASQTHGGLNKWPALSYPFPDHWKRSTSSSTAICSLNMQPCRPVHLPALTCHDSTFSLPTYRTVQNARFA
jgi:hypothetical protein